ncbi:hypothetical protein [Lewinella sp. IMCC34183]|uniref:hypothetical protein n=1 Tax=Lewinella sp. IMCC34183 TaxID=2248762 RepID=UPI000E281A1C|nr:hypothetical protein [Lewinella sp. IMCC34183]
MRILPLFLLSGFLLLTSSAAAQATYGELIYTRTDALPTKGIGDGALNGKMQELLGQLHASGGTTRRYHLRFSPGAFEFRELHQPPREIESGGIRIMVNNGPTPPDRFYTDTHTHEIHNSEAIADRMFQYGGPAPTVAWTLTGESVPASAATLGFPLLVARAVTITGDTLLARYAPALPVSFGPLNYYDLPGAILQLEITGPGYHRSYRAETLELSAEPLDIAPATEGKEVSIDEFNRQRNKFRARKPNAVRTVVRSQ